MFSNFFGSACIDVILIVSCDWFSSDVPEGNPAGHRHLQREGNSQKHLGAEARVQTLPGRGKD